jgi:secreted Zn-dependent insulinase-like peptidase
MTVDKRGKEILKEAGFNKFRQAFIDSLMKKISLEGKYGSEIRPIIEETLKEEAFIEFANKLADIIKKETKIDGKICNEAMSTLVEEDIADDIKSNLQGELEKHASPTSEELYSEGKKLKLWKEKSKHFLGKKTTITRDVIHLFKEHHVLAYVVFTGVGLLIVSSILFQSVYKALVVGLTLTVFPGESIFIKIANLLGGLGGLLLFFTSITIIIQYILLTTRRNERLQEIAKEYLKRNH